MGPWLGKSSVGSERQKAMQIEHFLQAGTAGGTVGKSSETQALPSRVQATPSDCRLRVQTHSDVCATCALQGVRAWWI